MILLVESTENLAHLAALPIWAVECRKSDPGCKVTVIDTDLRAAVVQSMIQKDFGHKRHKSFPLHLRRSFTLNDCWIGQGQLIPQSPMAPTKCSRQNLPDHLAVHVGQAHVAAAEAVGQPLVVDAQQVQHRGVQVVDLDLVLDGVVAVLVGRAVDRAALDAAAGQPDR